MVELLSVIAIIGVLAGIIIPVVGRVRAAAHDATCRSNLRQIGMAVQLYAGERRVYPPSASGGTDLQRGGAPAGQVWGYFLRPYLGGTQTEGTAIGTALSEVVSCPGAAVKVDGTIISAYSANPGLMPDLYSAPNKQAVHVTHVERPAQVILIGDAIQRDPQGAHSNFWNIPDMTAADNLSWSNPSSGSTPITIGSDTDGISEAQFRYRHRGKAQVVFADGHVGAFEKGAILRRNVRANY